MENQSSSRSNMKEIGSPKLLFEMLDLSSIRSVLWWDLHQNGPGRPVEYNPEWDLRALLRQLEQIRARVFAGKWIAVKDERVVTVSDSHDEIMREIKQKGLDGIYVFYSPTEKEKKYEFLF